MDKNHIKSVIRNAGEIIRENFNLKKKISTKSTAVDLVTDIDKQVEKYLINNFKKIIPDSAFLAEESDNSLKSADYLWVIDPIDGTTNFVHSFPFVCISVALQVFGETKLAFVYNPILNEFFEAEKGKGSLLNGKTISVSQTGELSESLLATGFPYDFSSSEQNNISYFKHFHAIAQGVRRPGSAALDLCYVAKGVLDGFWEWFLKPWDVAAGIMIIEEAGGIATNFSNEKFRFTDTNILAANKTIHQKMYNEILKL